MLTDYAEAIRWFRLAAQQGDTLGQFRLGEAYRDGQGVPRDYVAAYAWMNVAAADSSLRGMIASHFRDRLAEGMTAEQIADAQRMSRELWDQLESDLRD